MALNDLFQILGEVFIQGDGGAVRFGQGDALRQQPAGPRRGLDNCNGTLILFDDHLSTSFDALQDAGDIADGFHRAEMNDFTLHVFNHTSSTSSASSFSAISRLSRSSLGGCVARWI